jgi:hypothetical protein
VRLQCAWRQTASKRLVAVLIAELRARRAALGAVLQRVLPMVFERRRLLVTVAEARGRARELEQAQAEAEEAKLRFEQERLTKERGQLALAAAESQRTEGSEGRDERGRRRGAGAGGRTPPQDTWSVSASAGGAGGTEARGLAMGIWEKENFASNGLGPGEALRGANSPSGYQYSIYYTEALRGGRANSPSGHILSK